MGEHVTASTERTTTVLRPTPPFDFAASLRFLSQFPATRGEQVLGEQVLTKAFRLAGRTVGVRVTGRDEAGAPVLDCAVHASAPLGQAACAAVADRVGMFLGIHDDLGEFYRIGRTDPAFAPVVARLHGYHHVRFPSPWENVCWAILAQRCPLPIAQRMKYALVHAFDSAINVAGNRLWPFPEPGQLMSRGFAGIAELVRNERKTKYLMGAAAAYQDADEEFLRTGPIDEVRDWLLAIPGIGQWSASFVLIRGLGRMSDLPADPTIVRAASRVYGRSLSDSAFTALADRYGPWKAYWGHYLRVVA
jgi:DNA-3-methyladenine glycosylase II